MTQNKYHARILKLELIEAQDRVDMIKIEIQLPLYKFKQFLDDIGKNESELIGKIIDLNKAKK